MNSSSHAGYRARTICILLSGFLTASAYHASAMAEFNPGRIDFGVEIGGIHSDYEILAVYVDPGNSVGIGISQLDHVGEYQAEISGGELQKDGPYGWHWIAPGRPGLYPITIRQLGGDNAMQLNIFVVVPRSELIGDQLNGYRIGHYPSEPYKGLPVYEPPSGFVEVTAENQNTLLSPHFTLEQFLCKQSGDWPKYVVLREELLLKLELVLARANEAGYECSTFHVMSGYRTPHYNRSIGNVKYSRHQWGGAADIFIDENPQDGMMDDLNRDGAINWKDAAVLYDIVDELYGKRLYEPFVGGLARYKKTANHGPFVHLDVRGFRARWGD